MNPLFSPLRTWLPAGALLAGVLAAPSAQGQSADHKTAIGVYGSILQYRGDLGSDFWKLSDNPRAGGGLHITRYLSPSWDLSLQGNYQDKYRFGFDAPNASGFDARIGMIDLGLKLKLNNGKIVKEDAFVQPYLMGGGGLYIANSEGTTYAAGDAAGQNFYNQMRQPELFGAAGLRFRLTPALALDIQTSQHYLFTERTDNLSPAGDKLYDRFLLHSAGLTLALGKAKDEDNDGVPDRKDKCPGTPAGVKVDPNGCPLDRDGDGVADYQDKCPDQRGVAALQGCPDRDGDGVADADDQCPDQPGKPQLQGCPDADNDGVRDSQDKCPNTPAGVQVDANGCPLDRDGDGVPDYQDRCPDRPGPATNRGCPEIKAETRRVLQEATRYVYFDFNKATLKPTSYPKLDELVAILNEYPDYSLSIAGHTDSKGDDNYNLKLSYERAAAARTYMLSKGIAADRVEARGYGETKPIADNATEAGRAQNRRVDFDPYLTGDANAAEVKYGPAPTVRELLEQGKTSPVPNKATKTKPRKAPARRPARRAGSARR